MCKAKAYPSSWSARQWYSNGNQQTRSGLNVVAGADPSGAHCGPATKRFGPPGLYGSAAVEWTEPLASKAGGPVEAQVPQPHTVEVQVETEIQPGQGDAASLASGSSMVVA